MYGPRLVATASIWEYISKAITFEPAHSRARASQYKVRYPQTLGEFFENWGQKISTQETLGASNLKQWMLA